MGEVVRRQGAQRLTETTPQDLDELLALEDKRDAERLLWAEADAAFRTDVGLAIEIAKASAKAYEKRQRKLAEREVEKVRDVITTAAPVAKMRAPETVESPDEKRRRLARESMRRTRARERAARASEAAGQREAARARAEAFAAARGL